MYLSGKQLKLPKSVEPIKTVKKNPQVQVSAHLLCKLTLPQ